MTPLEKIAIVLIALAVVIVGAVVIYGRSLVRSHRERRELHRRRVENAERKEMMSDGPIPEGHMRIRWASGRVQDIPLRVKNANDTTKTLPVIEEP